MNRMKLMVVAAGVMLAAGSVSAQDAAKRAEEQRNSSEMMKPQTTAPERSMVSPSPQSEAKHARGGSHQFRDDEARRQARPPARWTSRRRRARRARGGAQGRGRTREVGDDEAAVAQPLAGH